MKDFDICFYPNHGTFHFMSNSISSSSTFIENPLPYKKYN